MFTGPFLLLAQVEKENFVIQELKNHLHQVLKFSESSLLRTRQEAEKQQKADFRASQARAAKIQQDILQLHSQLHSLVTENREAEQALRKVPGERAGGHRGGTRQGTGGGRPSHWGSPGWSKRPAPGRQEGVAQGPGAGGGEMRWDLPCRSSLLCDLGKGG